MVIVRTAAVALGAMLVLVLGGCGSEPETAEARGSLEASQAQVETRLQEAVDALRGAGFELPEATGEWRSCRSEPKAGMEFSAGGTLTGGPGDPAGAVAEASEVLEGEGWAVESSGETPRPYANLTDGDLWITVKESRIEPGTLSLGIGGACLDSNDELEGELLGKPTRLL